MYVVSQEIIPDAARLVRSLHNPGLRFHFSAFFRLKYALTCHLREDNGEGNIRSEVTE